MAQEHKKIIDGLLGKSEYRANPDMNKLKELVNGKVGKSQKEEIRKILNKPEWKEKTDLDKLRKLIGKETVPLTREAMEKVQEKINSDPSYGGEYKLLKDILNIEEYKLNTDRNIIALKAALIDVTNSTHLSQHKKYVSLAALADIILGIETKDGKKIDALIQEGNPIAVSLIAKRTAECEQNGNSEGRNLFSFATKYCHYHSLFVYGKDQFPIYDGVVSENLHRYYENRYAKNQPQEYRNSYDYKAYKKLVEEIIDDHNLRTDDEKKKGTYPYTEFDHFIWYTYRSEDDEKNGNSD